MPITGVYGLGGSGKNTIVAYIMKKHFDKFHKYVNFDLKLPNTTKIDSMKLFDIKDNGEIVFVIWDEAYTEGLDNRDSFTDENKIQSYLLFQARKKKFNVISIAQLNMLDTRWRQLEENYIYCYPRPLYNKDYTDYKGDFHYAYVSFGRVIRKFILKYKDAEKVFKYFNTEKTVLPRNFDSMKRKILMKNPKEVLAEVDRLTSIISEKYDVSKVTHPLVKKWLLDLGELEAMNLEKYIYIKLKEE